MDPVSKAQLAGNTEAQARKLANLRPPWKPGQSGNPTGRPRKRHITKAFERISNTREGQKFIQEVTHDILNKRGMAAVLLLREIAERTEGKVTQELELNVNISLAEQIAQRRLKRVNGDSES
jgi:Family of unknown function (DUF5681)